MEHSRRLGAVVAEGKSIARTSTISSSEDHEPPSVSESENSSSLRSAVSLSQEPRIEKTKRIQSNFWKSIEGVFTIVLTNKLFHNSKPYYKEILMKSASTNPYDLRHIVKLDRHAGDIPNQIVFVMLSKLKAKTTEEVTTAMEAWIYVFRDASLRTGERMVQDRKEIFNPQNLVKWDPAIKEILDRLDYSNIPWSVFDQFRNEYRNIKYYYDSIIDIENKAAARGEARGRQVGTAEDKEEGKVELIKTMLQNGTSIASLARSTGMSEEAIKAIDAMK